MNTIGFLAAFMGGVLSLLSPCSALLLPAFFAYAFSGLSQLVARTSLFYIGMCLTLVPLGAGLGAVGSFFDSIRNTVMIVAGVIIIIFGAMTIVGRGFTFGPAQRLMGKLHGTGYVSVLLLGAVYGLAGFCSGPILGSILAVAVAEGSSSYGALLMAVYALGMAAPLFLLAILWDRFQLGKRSWLHGRDILIGGIHINSISLISGLLFIAIGVLFVATDGTASLGGLVDMDTQIQAQMWASKLGDRSTNLIVVLVVLLLVLVMLLARLSRKRKAAPAVAELAETSAEAVEEPAEKEDSPEDSAASAAPEDADQNASESSSESASSETEE